MLYVVLIIIALAVAGRFLAKRFKKSYKTLNFVADRVIFEIKVPKITDEEATFKTAAMAMESFFASLHGLLKSKGEDDEYFSFEVISKPGLGIKFYVVCSEKSSNFVEGQIYANYPSSQVVKVDDNFEDFSKDSYWEMAQLEEIKNHIFPLKTYVDLELDSMSSVTSAMSQLVDGEVVAFQLLTKPVGDIWQKEGNDYVAIMKTGKNPQERSGEPNLIVLVLTEFWSILVRILTESARIFGGSDSGEGDRGIKTSAPAPKLTIVQEMEVNSIENKMAKMGFTAQARFLVSAKTPDRAKHNMRSAVASMNQFSTTNLNSLVVGQTLTGVDAYNNFVDRTFDEARAYVLNVEELGSLYHLPSQKVETPNIGWSYSRKTEPPAGLPTQNCTYIADTVFRDQKVRFGLDNGDDRLRHMYVIGKSGTGKSTIFENMISQDIANGFGVGVLDPHGETIDKVLDRIPSNRVDDVIYFDPSDTESPVGLNLLEMTDLSQKNLMASALVSAIKHHFDYSWGPRLEYLLNYAILTLLEVQGTTMLGITRLMEDDNYRNFILHNVKDPVVLKFWDTEFKNMKNNPRLITEAVAPIQNKVNRFLASSTIRNILGQRKSTIDIEDAMNNGKILLMNLSKGKIGEDNADLLGALLVSRIQFFALQRANIPSSERRPFYLYVDEFQNFATGSFESILSESRKYGLGLYLTHQYTAQLPEELLKAVLGNVGTIIAFALGTPDAKALQGEFAPYFTDTDIISLERFHVYMKLMMDGMTSLPFSAKILRPWVEEECIVPKSDNKQWVLELSRQKFGVDKLAVEDKVRKWVDTPFDKGMAISYDAKGGINNYAGQNTAQKPQVQQPVTPPKQVTTISQLSRPLTSTEQIAPAQTTPVAIQPQPQNQPSRLVTPPKQNIQTPAQSQTPQPIVEKNPKDLVTSHHTLSKEQSQEPVQKQSPERIKIDVPSQPMINPASIIDRGIFDGINMTTKDGKNYSVQPNYAAKSELVFGDELEMYKEGENDRFRQAIKVPRKDIEGTLQKNDKGLWGLLATDGRFYPVSQTAVEFNEFQPGQHMYGILPANIDFPPFCTLALKKYRKELQKQEQLQKLKTDQSLR